MAERNENSTRSEGMAKDVMILVILFVVALLISIILHSAVIINVVDASGSMKNTLSENSRIVGFRNTFASAEPERLDVVIFKNPDKEASGNYVMRVIGMPGETIKIVKGEVFIGKSPTPLDESSYLDEEMTGSAGPYTLPNDCYFMLGDNRNASEDSRNFGFISKGDILGKAYFEVFPKVKTIK